MKKITSPKEFEKLMYKIFEDSTAADYLLCSLVIDLGYKNGIEIFQRVERRYTT